MIETLAELDRELFLLLNGAHTPWLDSVMVYISKTGTWFPLYALLLFLIYRDYGWKGWPLLVGLALTITMADQITSSLMKPYFERLRPSHEPSLQSLVHIVDGYRGRLYGFASSHAANTFGAAVFLFLLLRKQRRWTGMLFLWASLVTYSRIYLGVHYPGDVLVGAIIGALLALIFFAITARFTPPPLRLRHS